MITDFRILELAYKNGIVDKEWYVLKQTMFSVEKTYTFKAQCALQFARELLEVNYGGERSVP